MNKFGLGDFADQLSIDQVNGALGNVGADYRVEQPAQGIQAPAAPTAPTGAPPPPAWEQEEKKKEGGGLGGILGLVGGFMGGAYGAALQGVGGMMGGKK